MNCSKVRDDLLQGSTTAASRRHLEECPACARFKERFEQTAAELDAHHLTVVPDRTFAARVVARLPVPEPPLGWAATRMLPAAVALLVVLSAWAWVGTATPSELVAWSPTDDLVGWVLGDGETEE
jgi:anti-sigma factor RsiW